MIQSHATKGNILIVDDMPDNLKALTQMLVRKGYLVRPAINGQVALKAIQKTPPDLILLDIMMPDISGYDVCKQLKADECTRDIPVIFMTALNDTDNELKGFELGAVDYITKPFQLKAVLARINTHMALRNMQKALRKAHDELEQRIKERTADLVKTNEQLVREIEERKRAEQKLQQAFSEIARLKDRLEQENIYLQKEIKLEHDFENIIGCSSGLEYILYKVEQVAPTDTTVLISGETGTGKELFARAIHHASSRKDRPLVKVDCATLPSHLIESELFGHERGAFTGATSKQIGRFELADGATIFLDEIGELPLELQSKLLRVLQEGTFERLGNPHTITVDVRVIAATNRDLEEEVHKGRFRQDLYYRLNVYPISIPPLRERKDDIPLLVQSFVHRFSKKLGKPIESIPQSTMDTLHQYSWPGNVRELENVIERAVINAQNKALRIELPKILVSSVDKPKTLKVDVYKTLAEIEREYILRILEKTDWKIAGSDGAALILGINPSTLRSRMQKLGIKKSVAQH